MQPVISLAVELASRGHPVKLFVPAEFDKQARDALNAVSGAKFEVAPLDVGVDAVQLRRAIDSDETFKDKGANSLAVISQFFEKGTKHMYNASKAAVESCDVVVAPYSPVQTIVPHLVCKKYNKPLVLFARDPANVAMPHLFLSGGNSRAASIAHVAQVSSMFGRLGHQSLLAVHAALSMYSPTVIETLPLRELWCLPVLLAYPTLVHRASALGAPWWYHQAGPYADTVTGCGA